MPINTARIVAIAALLALQIGSTLGMLTWLPTVLWARDVDPAQAGSLFSLSLLAELLAALGLGHKASAKPAVCCLLAGFAGTLLLPQPASSLAALLLGFGQGAALARAAGLIRRGFTRPAVGGMAMQ
ncbi:MAG: hypothetical protein JO326_05190 [Acetobacteraceae bacterium]|nr:hypothetical protein [Acetobacteraceae bacterium]